MRTLQAMLAFVRDGDTVVVHSMDRLARNLDDLRRLVRELTVEEHRNESHGNESGTFWGRRLRLAGGPGRAA